MSKMKIWQKQQLSVLSRKEIKNLLLNKYYSIYLNNYSLTGDIDYQQKDYVLKQFWAVGAIACFKLEGTENSTNHPQGLAVFTPFVPSLFNIYDWPTKVSLVNTRGVRFIPSRLMEVDKDVVIGFAQRNKKSVGYIVNYYIERMTDVLMVIKVNLKTHKMPWLIISTPEDEEKMNTLFRKLEEDDPKLFVDSDSADKFKALVSGSPYIIDKLYSYYGALENELREFLGFGNLGVSEKKEHLINEEVKANNAIIEANKNCLLDSMKEFFERVRDVLGININVEVNEPKVEEYEDENEEEEEEVEQNV